MCILVNYNSLILRFFAHQRVVHFDLSSHGFLRCESSYSNQHQLFMLDNSVRVVNYSCNLCLRGIMLLLIQQSMHTTANHENMLPSSNNELVCRSGETSSKYLTSNDLQFWNTWKHGKLYTYCRSEYVK